MTRYILFYALPALILFQACDSSVVFKDYSKTADLQWRSVELKKFDYKADVAPGLCNLFVSIRYIEGCPYMGVPVCIKIVSPSGSEKELKESVMIRNENEKYLGDVSGNIYDVEHRIPGDFSFDEPGTYRITMSHYSDFDPLIMIDDIGLIIKKSEKEVK
ncbi:MAG: hypothetical protein ABIJ16_13740 [Bacteroidota bacterium]